MNNILNSFKILLIILLATFITSSFNMYVSAHTIYEIINKWVPAWGVSWNTPEKTLYDNQMGTHHYISDTLYAEETKEYYFRVVKTSFNNISGDYVKVSNHSSKYITDEKDNVSIFMQSGNFRLDIKGKITYTTESKINFARWEI